MRLLSCFAVAVLLSSASAQPPGPPSVPEIHCKHFFYGYPTGTPITNDLVIRDSYALSSNDATRFADWVAYRLTPQEVFGLNTSSDFFRRFRTDPWLGLDETIRVRNATDNPYSGSGFERGHLAPQASFVGTEVMAEVNYFSNIVPQRGPLNGGPWGALEGAVRALVLRRAERALQSRSTNADRFPLSDDLASVWVMTGPLYEADLAPLPGVEVPHRVPSGFWLVISVQEGWESDEVAAAGFILGQDTPRDADPLDHLVAIDVIEARSDLDLLRLLPDTVEDTLEASPMDRDAAEALLFPDD